MAKYFKSASLCLLLISLVCGCSGNEEQKEPGAIEQMTDKVAQETVQNIRQPIEQAKQVQAIQDAHTRAVNEAIENSSQ